MAKPTTFRLNGKTGILVDVLDAVVAERLAPVLAEKVYTLRGLEQACPGAIQAVLDEIELVKQSGIPPERIRRVVVSGGRAEADVENDTRRVRGRPYGNR